MPLDRARSPITMRFRELYRSVRKMRKSSPPVTFQEIANRLGITKGMAYQIYQGQEPIDQETRNKLGLPAKCPHCHSKLKNKKQMIKPLAWRSLDDLTQEQLRYILINREPIP